MIENSISELHALLVNNKVSINDLIKDSIKLAKETQED